MLRRLSVIVALLAAASLAWAGEAAHVVFVAGKVHVGGNATALGNVVQEGDEIVTGGDGYVYLKTVDNGFLILRPNSRARIVTYQVDRQQPDNTHIKLELLGGVARAISGDAVKQARQNFRFNTPVAAIGVRGTDFTVFTDQEVSRVAVISGGVVVSGFSGTCGPEGGGPCEGGASRELFAKQAGQMLQVRKGQATPQMLPSSGVSPDVAAPPRSDEPNGKSSGANNGGSNGNADLNLDPQKNATLLQLSSQVNAAGAGGAAAPVLDGTRQVVWGRWQALAGLPEDAAALAKQKSGEYGSANITGIYFISRLADNNLTMPQEGRVAFNSVGSEAFLVGANGVPVAAQVQDPRLEVDFAKRSFATSMNLTAPLGNVDIRAQGGVTVKGELVSDITTSNSVVSGYLSGKQAQEAAYIFSRNVSPELSAYGATRWSR